MSLQEGSIIMGEWYVRLPMHNVELHKEIAIGPVRLVPLENHRQIIRRISSQRDKAKPFLYTADAIVALGASEDKPPNPRQAAWDRFWPVHNALSFLQQREFFVAWWHLHRDPDCGDHSINSGAHLCMATVPYETKIHVLGDYAKIVADAAALWQNEAVHDKTWFARAWTFQLLSLGDHTVQTSYVKQWMAFETLFNRWCKKGEAVPEDVKDVELGSHKFVETTIRPIIEGALNCLVLQGKLKQFQVKAVTNSFGAKVYGHAHQKAQAFLSSYNVTDVPSSWLQECAEIRNRIVHGDVSGEDSNVLHWRTMRLRGLVNRYIMHLMGYAPKRWDYASCSASYEWKGRSAIE